MSNDTNLSTAENGFDGELKEEFGGGCEEGAYGIVSRCEDGVNSEV